MAVQAERDQIVEGVVSEIASRTDVMNLQIRRTATLLAPPPVPHENLPPKLRVSCPIQPKARMSLPKRAHADLCSRDENVCFSWSGKSS